jgi:hypothetical protein
VQQKAAKDEAKKPILGVLRYVLSGYYSPQGRGVIIIKRD